MFLEARESDKSIDACFQKYRQVLEHHACCITVAGITQYLEAIHVNSNIYVKMNMNMNTINPPRLTQELFRYLLPSETNTCIDAGSVLLALHVQFPESFRVAPLTVSRDWVLAPGSVSTVIPPLVASQLIIRSLWYQNTYWGGVGL